MAVRKKWVGLVVGLIWLMTNSGCSQQARPLFASPTATATPFLPATATPVPPTATNTPTPVPPSPTPTITPSPTPTPVPRPAYRLDAELDYWQRSLTVAERITYPNRTGKALPSLVLNVAPAQWKGVFTLVSAAADGKPIHGTLDGTRWEIVLPTPLPAGQTTTLQIHYRLALPYKNASRLFGIDAHQVNLVDWYPFVVPYTKSAHWLWHKPWPFGDYLVYPSSDFDVTLHLKHAAANTRIAASALPDADGHYRLQGARTFVFSLSPEFQTASAQAKGITITSYYFPAVAAGGKVLPRYAAQAIATFTRRYGPLPRKHLAIVCTEAADGMEYSGLVFLSANFYRAYDRTLLNNLITLGMHELSHQWWYDQVGNDQAEHPWLDEALATYSEWVFYHDNYPADAPLWWNFRVSWFKPTGYINRSIYDYPTFRPYVNATYLQGARFMDALRRAIGDEAFFAFLQDYQRTMRGRIATPDDFFRILNRHTTPQHYQPVVKQYFTP